MAVGAAIGGAKEPRDAFRSHAIGPGLEVGKLPLPPGAFPGPTTGAMGGATIGCIRGLPGPPEGDIRGEDEHGAAIACIPGCPWGA